MEINVNYTTTLLELKKVFEPIVFISEDEEYIAICMRDTGFEIMYNGDLYEFKGGKLIQ